MCYKTQRNANKNKRRCPRCCIFTARYKNSSSSCFSLRNSVSKPQTMSHVFLLFVLLLGATDQSVAPIVTMVTWVLSLKLGVGLYRQSLWSDLTDQPEICLWKPAPGLWRIRNVSLKRRSRAKTRTNRLIEAAADKQLLCWKLGLISFTVFWHFKRVIHLLRPHLK